MVRSTTPSQPAASLTVVTRDLSDYERVRTGVQSMGRSAAGKRVVRTIMAGMCFPPPAIPDLVFERNVETLYTFRLRYLQIEPAKILHNQREKKCA
jgi:hypothetical protein